MGEYFSASTEDFVNEKDLLISEPQKESVLKSLQTLIIRFDTLGTFKGARRFSSPNRYVLYFNSPLRQGSRTCLSITIQRSGRTLKLFSNVQLNGSSYIPGDIPVDLSHLKVKVANMQLESMMLTLGQIFGNKGESVDDHGITEM